MPDIPEVIRRRMTEDDLRARFEATIKQRVNRHRQVSHQPMTPYHHFADASAECIKLYTDGYFLSTVMVTQAVAEGMRRFVVERNGTKITNKSDGPSVIALLAEKKVISENCAEAFNRIWRSFRNDVHHMNPRIATVDFPALAKRNIQNLAVIERELFDFKMDNGKIIPAKPQYWDPGEDGKVKVFLRLSP